MSKFKKGGGKELPAISTASLPDIVFMLLFFFMVATVMRQNTLQIENKLPYADQVEKLDKKSSIMYIYAGKPGPGYKKFGTEAKVQLDDKMVSNVAEIQAFVQENRNKVGETRVGRLIAALKVDKNTNMGLIGDVKEQLREVNQLKINYATLNGDPTKKNR